jgi:hypothetical protein
MRLLIRMLLLYQVLAVVLSLLLSLFVGIHDFKSIFIGTLIFVNCVGMVVQPSYRLMATGQRYIAAPRSWKFVMGAGVVVAGTIVGVTLAFGLLQIVYPGVRYSGGTVLSLFGFSLGIAGLVSSGIILYERLKKSIEQEALENQHLKELQTKTRLMVLQSKVNPHFLFNTLNTMLNLVYKSPGEVETIILNLSEIYRRILQLPEDGLISIREEMEFIRQYLEIEKIRLGERLAYTITVDPAVASFQIPPMIIEPIIENAVIHGIGPKPEGGSIRINAQQDAGVVRFIIEDDGAGVATQDINQGFGLYSVQERLRLMYRGKATFVLRALPGGGVKVMVELPHAD